MSATGVDVEAVLRSEYIPTQDPRYSRFTALALLSSRKPMNFECRR